MAKTTIITDANERSFNETMSQVSNSSNNATVPKKNRRSCFYLVRDKTVTMFERASKYAELLGSKAEKTQVLRNCLNKALEEVQRDRRYNEAAFKKDLATRMAYLINDKRFDRKCKNSRWSLFEEAQKLSWANDTKFGEIRDKGIENVKGFYTPNCTVYELDDLRADLLALDVAPEDLDNDPYSPGYEERCKKNPEAVVAVGNAKAEEGNSNAA